MTMVIAAADLHGQLGVFSRLAKMQERYPGAITVLGGDYVDGLPKGFEVLKRIRTLQQVDPDHVKVLMGNHDDLMLEYFRQATNDYWLNVGGKGTLKQAALDLGNDWGDGNREKVLAAYPDLLNWLQTCPLEYHIGKLRFVHAGYALQLIDPVKLTNRYDKLWLRGGYFYSSDDTFAHNPLAETIVTGHTATGLVGGYYAHDIHPLKYPNPDRSPVYRIAYPGEQPRYLIDGGIDPHYPNRCGNVAVFDSETGLLVDVLEDA